MVAGHLREIKRPPLYRSELYGYKRQTQHTYTRAT